MSELSVVENLPTWLKKAAVTEYPEINSVVIARTVIPGIGAIALTGTGIEVLASHIQTPEEFIEFLTQSYELSPNYQGNPYFKELPDKLLMKRDIAGEAIPTVLTHRWIDTKVPKETEEYIYDPISFHAGIRLTGLDLIVMDRAEVLPIISADQNRMVVKGWRRFSQEAATQGIKIIGTMQDVLHRGTEQRANLQIPRIAMVDQLIPNIHTSLKRS